MSTDERLQLIEAKVDTIVRLLEQPEKKPGLTITAFAKHSGLSYSTIQRKLLKGELTKVKGRIPYSQLTPYLS